MSVPRLVRSLHTTARVADAAAAVATTSAAVAPPRFTPKGRPIPTRPPRTTRVNLPSGLPEPPSYPPPASYFTELTELEAKLSAEQRSPKPHPLWAFFHVPPAAMRKIGAKTQFPPDMGSLERLDDEAAAIASGRSWTAAELRHKSFEDLHTLWYVLVRERNVLATQREERRHQGIPPGYGGEVLTKRGYRCRKTMARIKYVLNERRLALIAAGGPELGPAEPHHDVLAASAAIDGSAPVPSLQSLMRPKRTKKAKKVKPELIEAAKAEVAAEIAAQAAVEDAEVAAEVAAEAAAEVAAEKVAEVEADAAKKQ
ncbi:54S ribosomal protein L4, mitochondrial [Vanrija pseudolonga]|uniref:Large ribosomal subunit protein uL29m n=1 Tax=Vanrija pseudolonga TaxID=143232 RepID=A0AAF1BII2_9TREE|nr:54S ribosomal protein L4, mitochondrial [Vanrija pseudolonga]